MLSLLVFLLLWFAVAWAVRRGRPGLGRDMTAAGLLALATAGFFWRQLSGTYFTPADGGDLVSFLYPAYTFAQRVLQSGHLPLWNPHLYLGAPHVADVQAGWLYPPTLLVLLLRPQIDYYSLELLSIFHFFWAGLGTYFLVRYVGHAAPQASQRPSALPATYNWTGFATGRWPALAAALAFMFADPLLTHFGNYNLLAAASWLPWILGAFLAASWPLAGLGLALATLAGHPQTTLAIILALILVTGWQLYNAAGVPRRTLAVHLGRLAGSLLLAALLAAPVLLPAILHAPFTPRATYTYGDAAQYSLSPAQWIGFFLPAFFGRGPALHWGPWDRVEVGYIGVLPLALALLAVVQRPRTRTWLWVGLALTALLLALGIYSLPHGWLTLLPGFGQTRAPARFLLLTDLGLAVLAAIGLDGLLRTWSERDEAAVGRVWRLLKWVSGVIVALGIPLAYLALVLTQDRAEAAFTRTAIATINLMTLAAFSVGVLALFAARRLSWARPATLGALACALIFLDLASPGAYIDGSTDNPARSYTQQPEIVQFLHEQPGLWRIDARTGIEQLWQPDTAAVAGLDDIWGIVNPLILADVQRYWDGIGPEGRSSPLYDLLNAQFLIARKDVPLDWSKYGRVFDGPGELAVYRNAKALPRAFIVYQAEAVADHETAWQALHAPAFDPGRQVVVEGGTALAAGGAAESQAALKAVEVANGLNVTLQTDRPGYLVLSQPFYAGWQATDQAGHSLPVLRANYAFQAVAVTPETTAVYLSFRPATWTWGLILAGLGVLVFVAGLFAAGVMRHGQRQ